MGQADSAGPRPIGQRRSSWLAAAAAAARALSKSAARRGLGAPGANCKGCPNLCNANECRNPTHIAFFISGLSTV
jgi:hypothetical protein